MPAPRPVSISYQQPLDYGTLAVRAGEGARRDRLVAESNAIIGQTRQFQIQQQQIMAQERAFAMQQAYANRPQSQSPGVQRFPQQPAQPQQLQQQAANDQINQLLSRGTISPEVADRIRLGQLGVPASLATLGFQEPGAGQLSPQETRLRADFQLDAEIGALEQERRIAEQQAQAFLNGIPGGAAGMNDAERQQYSELVGQATKAREQQRQVYQHFAQTGALGGGSNVQGNGASQPAGGAVSFEQAQANGHVVTNAQGHRMYWNGSAWVEAP